jgi:hypothetical protein
MKEWWPPQLEWGFIFLHNTKSPKYGELKSYRRRIFYGLGKFFKSFQCCDNTLRIKKILIITIFSPFSAKTLSNQIKWKFSRFSSPPLPSKPPSRALGYVWVLGFGGKWRRKTISPFLNESWPLYICILWLFLLISCQYGAPPNPREMQTCLLLCLMCDTWYIQNWNYNLMQLCNILCGNLVIPAVGFSSEGLYWVFFQAIDIGIMRLKWNEISHYFLNDNL